MADSTRPAVREGGKKEEEEGGDVTLAGKEEVILAAASGDGASAEASKFDVIVGAIEDIVMDPSFRDAQERFCRANCDVFEDTDENKLQYTTLFKQYTDLTERVLMERLAKAVPDFNLDEFSDMLAAHKDEISCDLLDMLVSFGDFAEFKDLMLSYKAQVAFEGTEAGSGGGFMLAPSVTPAAAATSTA